jgi:hypothetical protein
MEARFFVAPMLLVLILLMVWQRRRSANRLRHWAQANAYEFLFVERRYLRFGPFCWTTSGLQEVFYVSIRERNGNMRNAFVRMGGWFLGQLSDRIDVRWDS